MIDAYSEEEKGGRGVITLGYKEGQGQQTFLIREEKFEGWVGGLCYWTSWNRETLGSAVEPLSHWP